MAYEHRERPIWAVQFHPEFELEYGSVVLHYSMEFADRADVTYLDERLVEDCLKTNARIFANFLQV